MKKIVLLCLVLNLSSAFAFADVQFSGTYQLASNDCKGEVATTVNIIGMDGTYIARTEKGFLYSASADGSGSVTINNGPKLICSGKLIENVFTGNCVDTLGAQCNVQYKK